MDVKDILRSVMLNAPALARLSGVSKHSITAILKGKRARLYPATRQKLAAGLRSHAVTLQSAADLLDPSSPTGSPPTDQPSAVRPAPKPSKKRRG